MPPILEAAPAERAIIKIIRNEYMERVRFYLKQIIKTNRDMLRMRAVDGNGERNA